MTLSRTSRILWCVMAAALGAGLAARRPARAQEASGASPDSIAAKAGIAALHRADSIATISGDPLALADLFDSAGVRQEPGSPAVVTRAAMLALDTRLRRQHPGSGIVRYVPHIEQTTFLGDHAVEWGYFHSEYIAARGAKPQSFRGNVLRVLRREPDGSWKFTHVMWNMAQ